LDDGAAVVVGAPGDFVDAFGEVAGHGVGTRLDVGAAVVEKVNAVRIAHKTAASAGGLLKKKHVAQIATAGVEAECAVCARRDPVEFGKSRLTKKQEE
jgi:hypothetical protein